MNKGLHYIILVIAAFLFSASVHAEQQYLYFDPFLDGRPYQGEIEVITEDYQAFYLSLEALQEILHINLKVDSQGISGWQYYQNQTVTGSFKDKQLTIAGKTVPLNRSDLIEQDGFHYLWSELIESWFDIKVTVTLEYLAINFDTDGKHPLFDSIKRRAKQAQVDASKTEQQQMLERDNQYQWFNWPSSDIRYSSRFGETTGNNLVVNSSFDAFAHNVNLLVNSSNNQSAYRMTARKESTWGEQSFNYELGDIYFPAGKFLRTSFSGRGFALHGNQLSQNHARNIQVEGQPGWDLELYREGQLIDYSKLDKQGRYTFERIDVNAGFNNYKVVLYGPNGEVQEKHYNFNVSSKGVYAGKWLPEFYYIEPNTMMLGSGGNKSAIQQLAVGHLNYGMSDNIHVGLGGIVDMGDGNHDTPFAELRYSDTDHYFDVGVGAPKSADAPAWSLEYFTRQDFGMVRYNRFKTFAYDQQLFQSGQSLSWQRNSKGLDMGLSYSAQSQAGITRSEFGGQFGVQAGQHNFSTRVNYSDSDNYTASMLARLTLSDHLVQFRADLKRNMNGLDKELNLAWRKRYDIHNVSVNSTYSTESKQWGLNADYSLDVDKFRFGARVSRGKNGGWSLGLSFSTALVWDAPVTSMSKRNYHNASRVKTRAFWDRNGNSWYDEGDEPLAGVQFRGASHWLKEKSDEKGETVLYGAYSYQPQYIEVDPGDMDNPFLSPKVEKFKVTSHPGGEVSLDIPFVEHFELEGDIKAQKSEGLVGLGNVPLLLMQGETVVKRGISEYDGYFLFDDVPQGSYTLAISPEYIAKKSLPATDAVAIELKSGDDGLLILDPIVFDLI